MSGKMKLDEAGERDDVEIGHVSITGYECVKSNYSKLTVDTQEQVLEAIVRGADKSDVANLVFEAASKIDADDPDWEYLGIPQGLNKGLDPEREDQDDFYSWSSTGDHPRDEAPRAAWFANHLLDVKFSEGSKPLRAKVKPTHTVNGEQVDVIAYESERDLRTADGEFKMDVSETQRKTLQNPLEDILDAFGLEVTAALRGKVESQSGLSAFM